ncbi:MAG: acetyl-CoA carboxylase biotin carboxyl carrier protein subunit [Rhodospirillaceae bacterium]|nr:acetyl-CoA carboxylase biotin carboxyl carrier protein subunit [Rhodospirillaceae bacterium]
MANKFDVDPDLVRKLAELLGETGLSEIEYESTGRRIRVARQVGGVPVVSVSDSANDAAPPAPANDGSDASGQQKGTPIVSPMVGTVFASPEPGADPFVRVGDTIIEGQTVMLIEAMKTYNPIRATKSGRVAQILVGDSTPVEFGEELLLVE